MKISLITDEFTQSIDEAIMFAVENGLQGVELRSVNDLPIHDFSVEQAAEWKQKLDSAGLLVSNLSSSFFKCSQEKLMIERELEKLERLCQLADVLKCETIRGFSFFKEGQYPSSPEKIAASFIKVTEILNRHHKTMVLEADPSVNTTNHKSLARLLRCLPGNCFSAVYDPGNCLFDPEREEAYPTGYETIRPFIRHVHIKDAVYNDGDPLCVAPGDGLVGFREVLGRLRKDGYDGWLSLEPHYRRDSVLTEAQMRTPSGAAFSSGGREAMLESVQALKKMLNEINWIPSEF